MSNGIPESLVSASKMAYIPPHLRNKVSSPTSTSTPESPVSPGFTKPRTLADLATQTPVSPTRYTQNQIIDHLGSGGTTLNEIPGQLGTLGLVMLFHRQHPDWPYKILAKSNLKVLPGHRSYDPNDPDTQTFNYDDLTTHFQGITFPVFLEHNRFRKTFEFQGHFKFKTVAWLKPGSRALVEVLEQKFGDKSLESDRKFGSKRGLGYHDGVKKRSAEAWEGSLGRRWAVVEVEKVDGKDDNPMDGPAFEWEDANPVIAESDESKSLEISGEGNESNSPELNGKENQKPEVPPPV